MKDFEDLYQEYYPSVYKYLLSLGCDENLAEEITQDTFLKVLSNIKNYRGDCKLSVWICQIAKNTLCSYLKKHKRANSTPIEILEQEKDVKPDVESLLINKEMAIKIHEVLHVLEEPYREVFWMRTFGELSFLEIAKVHGKTESWARVTYHRAKLKIKEALHEV